MNKESQQLNNLHIYQEAIECLDEAISINPKYENAWINKGIALHKIKKFKDAIFFYDQALSQYINPLTLRLKADSLFELGNENEAKQSYLFALEKRSKEKDYIQKQLEKF
ncbi:unnamed protein product [Paramecium pentaurelia]|uniref:Tetratricopeptide repeat protein n=1 Tax=Paramecium pentaurelia TaxID=43138 RepID=A0A8S1UFS0_9CILI|nr:unnamed protein product [Paramecium pentaurelia]